jgi:DNA-binding MarR family transcriptional regulator
MMSKNSELKKSATQRGKLGKADYEALAAFRAKLRLFLHFTEEGARQAGLTPRQHQLLLSVKGSPGCDWAHIGELATALQISHHAAVGLVNRCERGGWARRESDPNDRRQVRVLLTPEGEAILEELSERNRAELQQLRQALQFFDLEE